MILSTVNLSEIYRHLRIDAEFYKPEYLHIAALLESKTNIFPLRKYCNYIKKGIFDISPELYVDNGIPLIRTSEIKDPLITFSTTVFLQSRTHQENLKTEIKPDDIVVTKIGAYIGDVALLPKKYSLYNFSQNVTGLSIKKKSINSKYLFSFLYSKFGRSQLTRIIMLSGQGKIELDDIRDISIYQATNFFQSKVAKVIEISQQSISKSEAKFTEAQNILLSELCLTNWQPKHQLSFVRNFSEAKEAGRMDAEYFQPKYSELEASIKNYYGGYSFIKDEFKQRKNSFKINEEKTYQYVEIGSVNISNGEITPDEVTGKDLPANAKRIIKKGDIIISKVRTYRGAITIVEDNGYVASGAFTILTEKGKINKETLLSFLHSKPILAWSLQPNTGTSYPVITDDDILNMPVPILPPAIQDEIRQKITESFSLRRQSKHLLECAKRAVELAIEQDEQTAIDWLERETGASVQLSSAA